MQGEQNYIIHNRFSQKKSKKTSKVRSVQNIFSKLVASNLLVRLPKNKRSLACEVEYEIPFLLDQEKISEDFIRVSLSIMRIS